jgi:hypothetical protein
VLTPCLFWDRIWIRLRIWGRLVKEFCKKSKNGRSYRGETISSLWIVTTIRPYERAAIGLYGQNQALRAHVWAENGPKTAETRPNLDFRRSRRAIGAVTSSFLFYSLYSTGPAIPTEKNIFFIDRSWNFSCYNPKWRNLSASINIVKKSFPLFVNFWIFLNECCLFFSKFLD